MSGITRDEWIRALAEAGEPVEDDRDALTVREFGEMFGMTRPTAERRLQALVTQGKAIKTYKRVRVASNNRMVSLIAFRLLRNTP